MLKNTERKQKIEEKKKNDVFFNKYFSICLIGAIQDTDFTTPRKEKKETEVKKKKMQVVYTQIHWCKKCR